MCTLKGRSSLHESMPSPVPGSESYRSQAAVPDYLNFLMQVELKDLASTQLS